MPMIAFAGRDVARLFAVAAGGLLRQIGLQAAQPFFRLGLAVLGDHTRANSALL